MWRTNFTFLSKITQGLLILYGNKYGYVELSSEPELGQRLYIIETRLDSELSTIILLPRVLNKRV